MSRLSTVAARSRSAGGRHPGAGPIRALFWTLLTGATAGFVFGCHLPGTPPRPDVVLVTIDTLRADHLGGYGHFLDTSPVIDALAERGVRFEDASVQYPKTWPSMASMLTGNPPSRTGVRYRPRAPLPEHNETLAEILRAEGYRTVAVVANPTLADKMGYAQGFDTFVESWDPDGNRFWHPDEIAVDPKRIKSLTNASLVTDQALAALADVPRDTPLFLWVHFMDPHGPYVPPEKYDAYFADAYPEEVVPLRRLPSYQRQKHVESGEWIDDLGFYRRQYDREIRHADEELGRLLASLDERAPSDGTITIVTSDHGESLGEHRDYLEHGLVSYQTNIRVPLVLVFEEHLPAGEVARAPVALLDLVPTILDLLQISSPSDLQGSSLLPLIRSSEAPARDVFAEAGVFQPHQRFVRRGAWKLIQFRNPRDRKRFGTDEFALHNLKDDPDEEVNVIREHPEIAAELGRVLATFEGGVGAPAEASAAPPDPDRDTRVLLEALGYTEDQEGGQASPP